MPLSRILWGWCPLGQSLQGAAVTAWDGGQLVYAPLTALLYRSDSYSPWLASIIVRRILSCSRRFLSTCRLVRRKRMMPEGNPMALQDSQKSRRWREWVGKQGCCATLGLHGQCPAQYYRLPSPLFHPGPHRAAQPPSADLLPPPEPLTRPPPPASSGSCPSCVWGCTPPPRGAPRCQAPDWPVVPLAGGSSAQRAVSPGGPAASRPWPDTLKVLLPPAVLRGEKH